MSITHQLLTFDNGVVAAPVQEDTDRRIGTAIDLVPLAISTHSEERYRELDACVALSQNRT